MRKELNQKNKGYIALTTAIILSMLMLMVAVNLGTATIISQQATSVFSDKAYSRSLVMSCLEIARLKLQSNSNYAGNETFSLDSYQCTLFTITVSGSNKIIQAKAQVRGTTTDLKLTINSSDLSTVSLEELQKL